MSDSLDQVREFWNGHLCGEHFIQARYPSREFFHQYRRFRYEKEHHLNTLIDWRSAKGKSVLEVGLGVGADATRWGRYASSYMGIDLTEQSTRATRIHLDYEQLDGTVLQGSVESLPFSEHTFDTVYSHGVLHHTPRIELALKELYRVLKPDGQMILMLYSKSSFNYWLRIQMSFRIALLYYFLARHLGAAVPEPWKTHLNNLSNRGWSYFSWRNWPHRCTDGPDCEIANIYSGAQIRKMLVRSGFKATKMIKAHFPLGGRYPKQERFLAKYIGFYQFVWATKTNGLASQPTSVNHTVITKELVK